MIADQPRRPGVSVVVPCFNEAGTVGRTIESVLAQSYDPVELLVVDDGSSDDSWSIIQSYSEELQTIRLNHGGASRARNEGLRASAGRLVMFLDADDFISQDTLDSLVTCLAGCCERSVASCPWKLWTKTEGDWDVAEAPFGLEPPDGDALRGWLNGWYIPSCAVLWRRVDVMSLGGWDETLVINQDGDLMIRALLDGISIRRANGGMAYYRKITGANSVSQQASAAVLESKLKVLDKVHERLKKKSLLPQYRVALGRAYHRVMSAYYQQDPRMARRYLRRARELAGRKAIDGPLTHRIICRALGLERKERIKGWLGMGAARRTDERIG